MLHKHYSDVGEAEVVEIVDYVKRSEDGRRKFIISALGDNIELNLQNAVGLLPQTLPVSVINVDQDGNQIVEDWTHTVSSIISTFIITIFSELPMVFLWIQHKEVNTYKKCALSSQNLCLGNINNINNICTGYSKFAKL